MSVGPLKDEIRDQSLHFSAALLILGLVAAFPSVWTFALAGFGCGLVREISELGLPVTLEKFKPAVMNQKLDLTVWTLGGAVTYLLFG
jgi:hypothetical protein